MNNQQSFSFAEQPLQPQVNKEVSLLSILKKYSDGRLKIPHFQRGPVWKQNQIAEWVETIIEQSAVGVIVTYQLTTPENGNNHPIYLNDGRQRLEATMLFLETPSEYGFHWGNEQAEMHVDAFSITVQHRHYKSHKEAYLAFRKLNRGTAATPAEFYKGELTIDPVGRHLWDTLPKFISDEGRNISKSFELNSSKSRGKYTRDALALYYQFVSGTDTTVFWNISKMEVDTSDDEPVEKQIKLWIAENGGDVERKTEQFKSFITQQVAFLEQCLFEHHGEIGHVMSLGLYRCLLHFGIWRRNTKLPVTKQKEVVMAIFKHSRNNSTTILFQDKDGELQQRTLNVANITKLFDVCNCINVDLKKPKARKKDATTKQGFDSSHLLPFSEYGDGETFPEPASLNRARGAKPVNDEAAK